MHDTVKFHGDTAMRRQSIRCVCRAVSNIKLKIKAGIKHKSVQGRELSAVKYDLAK